MPVIHMPMAMASPLPDKNPSMLLNPLNPPDDIPNLQWVPPFLEARPIFYDSADYFEVRPDPTFKWEGRWARLEGSP
jgi:hypothetical protein